MRFLRTCLGGLGGPGSLDMGTLGLAPCCLAQTTSRTTKHLTWTKYALCVYFLCCFGGSSNWALAQCRWPLSAPPTSNHIPTLNSLNTSVILNPHFIHLTFYTTVLVLHFVHFCTNGSCSSRHCCWDYYYLQTYSRFFYSFCVSRRQNLVNDLTQLFHLLN